MMVAGATRFEAAGGDPVRGYLLLKQHGGNIPPSWIERSKASRRSRQKDAVRALQEGGVSDVLTLQDWSVAFRKEVFYLGISILFELERTGKSRRWLTIHRGCQGNHLGGCRTAALYAP